MARTARRRYSRPMLLLLLACASPDIDADALAFPTTREAWWWPFDAASPWNTPVGEGLVAGDDACTADLRDPSASAWINAEEWSLPVVRASDTDPLVTVYEDDEPGPTVAVPPDAEPALPAWPEGDAHLAIVAPDGASVTELWHARRREDGGFDADSVAQVDLLGSGIGTGGVRIYGGSGLAGVWRAGEAARDAHHALALALPLDDLAPRIVWPATELSTSREADMTGAVPVGQHVALPSDLDLGFTTTAAGRALARALQDYGAFVVDHSESFALYAEPAAAVEVDGMRADLDAIRARLRCSGNVTEAEPGGPGARARPDAPPFAGVRK